ncbi:hypothetical protein AUJ65_05430 [Candidatus Micrarchaeota archaeon CG1_02_51_15]|nr:MAG: hypothetical protein AUJ65_05430 [Candidatus Micrarchaeota archaeon CG1_02_51_15]
MAFDALKKFFAEKILLPRVFRMDVPGYIVGKFYTFEGQSAFVRSIFMPEHFFTCLETRIEKKLGKNGLKRLYCVGKKFGWRFSKLHHLSTKNVRNSVDLTANFLETLYAEKLSVNEVDVQKKWIQLETIELAITRVNNGGYALPIGAWAGVWAFLNRDLKLECALEKRKSSVHVLSAGPRELLKKSKKSFFECDLQPKAFSRNYTTLNTPPTQITGGYVSLNSLLDSNFFNYEAGKLELKTPRERFVSTEVSLLYWLEEEFGDLVEEAAFECFSEIGKANKSNGSASLFLAHLLTALGFGLVDASEGRNKNVALKGFPCLDEKSNVCKQRFVQGATKGIYAGFGGSKAKLKKISTMFIDNKLAINLKLG